MFGLGLPELLVVLFIVLIVFGAGRLPQLGDALGRTIKNFKKATASDAKPLPPRDEADALPTDADVEPSDAPRKKV